MEIKELKPKQALNKAFLKVKPNRTEIEGFKTNLITLLDRTNDTESEEFHKNLVIDFLKKTYYDPNHFINTKGRNDLVIHNGNNAKSSVGVIIEAKKPTNKIEMLSKDSINKKAFQELVLYYLRERITHKNIEVKYLIATNINEWFIFDATLFDRLFAQNKKLVDQFNDFEGGRLADTKTDFFYKQIAEPFIADIKTEIEFTYFNIQDYQQPLRNADKADDNKLIALFKLLSAEHLLKLPFTNDSNSLDKRFYSELLHIIGLTETKEGGKKLIERNKDGERNSGSILEDAIIQLDSLDKINRLEKPSQFGNTQQERLFNVGLELSITWINRILFLKLLEAQLITYHKGDKSYSFLNLDKIKNYDDLNSLFFQVLARKYEDRNQDVKLAFEKVPYLNSSLFEPTEIEQVTLFISNLNGDKTIPVISTTVLKNDQGKKRIGNITTLAYLFDFLNAYDFASEGSEEIQEDNKSLINASVLGLIFEKINGYKDGSFFTPGFITMYMCRETIRKAVVQKFNEHCLNQDLQDCKIDKIEDIYELIPQKISRQKANEIINSIKICDPAVGSGHFLVSALNEMIAVKNDLKILEDKNGKSLHRYEIEVVNDELIVTDENGELFDYYPTNKESQRIQETLFHEKQTIIENCLFGVDINPNSVKICRLRLWIELLKNAYYKNATELETLPNIDINIKCGNSLVSRFAIDSDLSQTLKKSKWSIDMYRIAVDTYRNAESKEQKREMERLITDIKSDFRSEISKNDPKLAKLYKLNGELTNLITQQSIFGMSDKEKKDWNKKVLQLTDETKKIEFEIEEIKSNKIFENAFEWRFEFPEVLNDNGDFVGFDVVIGNPPYIKEYEGKEIFDGIRTNEVYQGKMDIWYLFASDGINLLKPNGLLNYIAPNNWVTNSGASKFRNFILENAKIEQLIDFGSFMVFDTASIQTMIMLFKKEKANNYNFTFSKLNDNLPLISDAMSILARTNSLKNILLEPTVVKEKLIDKNLTFSSNKIEIVLDVIASKSNFKLNEKDEVAQGIVPNPDVVNNKNILKLPIARVKEENIKVGDGVFVVDKGYFDNLSIFEKGYIKPVYEPYLINKYFLDEYDKEIIYITKKNFKNDAPKLILHLEKFKEIMDERRENELGKLSFNNLHWPRDSYFFEEGEKILCVRKCAIPTFSFTEEEAYVMMSFNVIRSNRINLKYLTGLLNSRLIKFWLKNKGKMQGNNYQIDKAPILDLPLINPIEDSQIAISSLVSKIIEIKKQNPQADTTALETQIDQLVYQLYDLTEEEIKIVEGV